MKLNEGPLLRVADPGVGTKGATPVPEVPAAPAEGRGAPSTAPRVVPRDVSSATTARPKPTPAKPKRYRASIFTTDGTTLPPAFVNAVQRLEADLKMPVWLVVQGAEGDYDELGGKVVSGFMANRKDLPRKPIALLVHSYGGFAICAYQLARLLRRHCGGFTAIIPRRAKSAATLLVMGADQLIMGEYGELGPLDVQVPDLEREVVGSALDEVQTLERLNAFSMQAVDRLMFMLTPRTGKRIETLLPIVLHFVSENMRPLLEKIDTVHYTSMSRELRVAEEYAVRLLRSKMPDEQARDVARHLVEHYTEHRFPIYLEEAKDDLNLPAVAATSKQAPIFDVMLDHLDNLTAIGRIKEVVP
jgi:serine dehydrogenase proteinase